MWKKEKEMINEEERECERKTFEKSRRERLGNCEKGENGGEEEMEKIDEKEE